MRMSVVVLLFVSSCASAPMCRRVTMLKTAPNIGLFLPHWHLVPGDVVLNNGDTVTIAFHTGDRLTMTEAEFDLVQEECR